MKDKKSASKNTFSKKNEAVDRHVAQSAAWRHVDEIEKQKTSQKQKTNYTKSRFSQERLNDGIQRNASGDMIRRESSEWRNASRDNVGYRSISNPAGSRTANQSAENRAMNNATGNRSISNPAGNRIANQPTGSRSMNNPTGNRSTSNPANHSNTSADSRRNNHNVSMQKSKKVNAQKKKKKKGCCFGCGCLPMLLIMILVFAGISVSAASAFLNGQFQKIEKFSLDEDKITVNDYDPNMSDYENIALFGVDNQDNHIGTTGSRTDCIIIASIHKKTKAVKLMSIYRDTYVSIDGKYDKINAAYSYGGPEQALNTINRNLDLNIQDFATVNFKALADAVDVLGGVTLTVDNEKELENLNDYIHNMNNINGGDSPKFSSPDSYPFTAVFDGNQAVAYARIRYMDGGDHKRASHQRIVVQTIFDSVKKKPWKLKELIDVVLPQCKTSLSSKEMTMHSLNLLRYKLVDSQAYPFKSEDERYNGIYYGFPLDVYHNVQTAHEYLFGTKEYEPCEELQKISEKVSNAASEIGLE